MAASLIRSFLWLAISTRPRTKPAGCTNHSPMPFDIGMGFRLATWNINSVRLRIGLVEKLLKEHQPDILCLQETKCPQGQFPSKSLTELGYTHIAEFGQ